jgi:hypothetical protein
VISQAADRLNVNVLSLNKEAEWAITCASHVSKWVPEYVNLMHYPETVSVLTECALNSFGPAERGMEGGRGS